ncbi:MAG: sulfur transferase domain-containing protein [Planctomycetota bacterium]
MKSLLPLTAMLLVAACSAPEAPQAGSGTTASPSAPAPESAPTAAEAGLPTELTPATLCAFSLADTKNVHVFDGVLTAAQPSAAALEAARALGVKSVLNQRKPAEMEKVDFDERAVAEGLGMTYTHMPWNGPDELTDELLDQTRAYLREAPRPILYHCASANRVGAGWAAWRALDGGVDIDTAIAEGKAVGMRTEAYEPKVRDYVARRAASGG